MIRSAHSALLASVIAVLAAILFGTTASASAAYVAETRVGASAVAGEVLVEPPGHERPGQRQGKGVPERLVVVATGVAANGGRRSVAIGEDMTNRVEPFAKKIGADTYKADPTAPREMWMKNNRDWIRKQMDDGCTIYDCGPAPGRSNFPSPTSPYYKMELDEIGLRNYPYYFRVPVD